MVTVTRTFTRRVDEEFAWKDPKAADKVGMAMMDYVIGGMDRSFKLKLFYTLYAAEQAGLQPGITSAFRDDYRQSIASGLKAATERSYHGGSLRGGYGRGLAADIVSVKGNSRAQRWVSTEKLWKWIDERGKDYGIGRPYLDQGSAPCGADRRPGICLPPRRRENAGGGSEDQEEASGSRRGTTAASETGQNRAVQSCRPKPQGQGRAAKIAQAKTAKTARSRRAGPCSRFACRTSHALPAHGDAASMPASAPVSSGSIVSILSTASRKTSARIPDRIGQHGVKLTLGESPWPASRPACGFDTTLSTGRAQAAAAPAFASARPRSWGWPLAACDPACGPCVSAWRSRRCGYGQADLRSDRHCSLRPRVL